MKKKASVIILGALVVWFMTALLVPNYMRYGGEGADLHNTILSRVGFVLSWCSFAALLYGIYLLIKGFRKK